jgi:hypothetical protein
MLDVIKIDIVAEKLHNNYRKKYPGNKCDISWDALPEEIKERNRAQVREFPALAKRYDTGDTEALARGVHECWMHICADKSDL